MSASFLVSYKKGIIQRDDKCLLHFPPCHVIYPEMGKNHWQIVVYDLPFLIQMNEMRSWCLEKILQISSNICNYTHDLKIEVWAISGGYELDTEGKIEVDGREILYAVVNAVVDSSCCGSWGCRYALVPGYVLTWKYRENEEGIPGEIGYPSKSR